MTKQIKPREEIEQLKTNWLDDPCWDIEDTKGFEEHREELTAFHEQMRQKWEQSLRRQLQQRAKEMGTLDNPKLTLYILALEARIERLEQAQEEEQS